MLYRIACLALLAVHLAALAAPDDSMLDARRAQYRAAMEGLERGDPGPFRRSREALADYPLFPYLELAELRQRLPQLPFTDVDRFLERYGQQLPAARLRAAWLDVLEERERWGDFLRYHAEEPAGIERRCSHARALLATGATAEADAAAEAIWLTPRSLPGSCDPLFQSWTKRGNPTPAIAWQRFQAAMTAGETGLARYLTRHLDAGAKADANLFLLVAADPALVKNTARFARGNPRHAQIVAFGLARLAGRDAQAARNAFDTWARNGPLDDGSLRGAAPRIAVALAGKSPQQALHWIMGLKPALRDEALSEDAVRYALRGEGWEELPAALDLRPPSLPADDERWQYWDYWKARSVEARGEADPRGDYARLAAKRSYYGFLAADRVGQRYAMEHKPVAATGELLRATEARPDMQRAREFQLIGEAGESRREWLHAVGTMDRSGKLAAASIASRWGWHPQVISLLGTTKEWDLLDLRFPTLSERDFERAARDHRIDRTWLYAIARQESTLNATVRSPAGALGLMQVMPATAEHTARKAGLAYRGSSDLLRPATNVAIGSTYMRMMLDRFQQNRILAAAAYNAGPGRVQQWLARLPAPAVEHDRFVETIPFRETRKYVQNVLQYAVIYAYLEGRSVPVVSPAEKLIRKPPG